MRNRKKIARARPSRSRLAGGPPAPRQGAWWSGCASRASLSVIGAEAATARREFHAVEEQLDMRARAHQPDRVAECGFQCFVGAHDHDRLADMTRAHRGGGRGKHGDRKSTRLNSST